MLLDPEIRPVDEIETLLEANLEGSRILKIPFAEANTLLYLGVLRALKDDPDLNRALEDIIESSRIFSHISAAAHPATTAQTAQRVQALQGELVGGETAEIGTSLQTLAAEIIQRRP